jgi:hypothetical protein
MIGAHRQVALGGRRKRAADLTKNWGRAYFADARWFVPDDTVSFICILDKVSAGRQRILSLSQSVRCPQREQAITVPIKVDERNARGLPK